MKTVLGAFFKFLFQGPFMMPAGELFLALLGGIVVGVFVVPFYWIWQLFAK